MAAISPPRTPASRSARPTAACTDPQMSSRSCSTQPGLGKICRNSRLTRERTASRLSTMTTVVPVVPWSIAITYDADAIPSSPRPRPSPCVDRDAVEESQALVGAAAPLHVDADEVATTAQYHDPGPAAAQASRHPPRPGERDGVV